MTPEPEPGSGPGPAPGAGREGGAAPDAAGDNPPDREALDRALRFIDYRPRSGGETFDRLRKWGYPPSVCRGVVEFLERCGVIDDRQFGRVFLGEMLRKNLGFNRIRFELARKKLDTGMVDEILEEYPFEGELDRAVGAAAPLARRAAGRNETQAARGVMASLVRRGYSRAVARRAAELALDVDTENWRE